MENDQLLIISCDLFFWQFQNHLLMIGSKKTQGEGNQGLKRFNNGHKHFTSAEAMELVQVLKVEERLATNFDKNKMTMIRPRNPLVGEKTPRDEHEGVPLIREDAQDIYIRSVPEITKKIGSLPDGILSRAAELGTTVTKLNKDAVKIRTLQSMHDDITGELEYWKLKVSNRERLMHTSLMKNRMKQST